jgi:hypothetical protein
MKRQLGAILITGMLLCASLAWSQSGNTGPAQGGFTSSSQTLFTNSSPNSPTDSGQSGAGDPGQSGSSGGDTTQSGSIGPQDTFKNPEQLPGLDLFSDQVSHTGVTFNTTVGSLAQHVSYSGLPGYWQALSSFGAGLSLAQSRPSYGWVLSYNSGINLTSGTYNYTNLNQSVNAQVTWNFAKRWQLRLKEQYFYSDDPFQPFLTYIGQPSPNDPYPITYLPNAVIEQNQAHLDLSYELGPHDILNFTFAEGFNRYLRQEISSLYDSVTYSEGVFYQHNFSSRLSTGGGYQFAALDFGHGQSRAGVQTFEGFVQYVFSPRITASLWVGPQSTSTKDIVPVFCYQFGCFYAIQHQKSLSVANGGTFDWKIGSTDRLSVQGTHGVSNAGGLLGAAEIYQLTGTYARPLTPHWNFGVGVAYNNSNTVIQGRQQGQYLHSISSTVGVTRRLFNDSWDMNAYYAYIRQSQDYFGAPATVSTSGAGFTIRYVWSHGFGR